MGMWNIRYTDIIPVVLETLVEDCCNCKEITVLTDPPR